MSGTTGTTTPASNAVAIAQTGAQFVATVQATDPALYGQLVGTLSTYSKSAAAPVVGAIVGLAVAKLGLDQIVTPDLQNLLTEALVGIGTAAGAAIMHWWSKAPGRALQAADASVVTAPLSSTTIGANR